MTRSLAWSVRLASLALCAPLLGCSSSSEEGGGDDPGPPRLDDEVVRETRAACGYGAGALPIDTLGKSERIGGDIPVDHIIILMMENRSFDHYLSKLPEHGVDDVDVADETFANPDTTGQMINWRKVTEDQYCVRDPDHGRGGSLRQYNEGKNDGFVLENEPDGARAMAYFDRDEIPFYYDLAKEFAIGDRYFCSMLGPTWPNRMYLYSGSSWGLTGNSFPTKEVPNIFQALIDAGIEWKNYKTNLAPPAMFLSTFLESTAGCGRDNGETCRLFDIEKAVPDIVEGNLPPVTFIDPGHLSQIDETSEHPPGNVQVGQKFVWEIVDAVTRSKAWDRIALFITYDEHGGFADHVPPPPACDPLTGDPDDPEDGKFDRYGFRVPLYVVSPYAKKGYVSHEAYDHTSILRFVQARFGIGAFSARDANADPMMDLFDFENPPHAQPPSFEQPSIEAGPMDSCQQQFGSGYE